MFKRRERLTFWRRVREFFAPAAGWRRVFEYYSHRMKRLPDSPTRIAVGFACGVYVSFTPFFGLHFLAAAALAWVLRANILASAIGTFFGNPVTFPFIAAASIELGSLYFGTPFTAESFHDMAFLDMVVLFLTNVHELVIPYFVGGLAPGLICAVVSYYVVRPLVARYQARRRAKLVNRAKARIRAEATTVRAAEPAE